MPSALPPRLARALLWLVALAVVWQGPYRLAHAVACADPAPALERGAAPHGTDHGTGHGTGHTTGAHAGHGHAPVVPVHTASRPSAPGPAVHPHRDCTCCLPGLAAPAAPLGPLAPPAVREARVALPASAAPDHPPPPRARDPPGVPA